MPVKTVNIEAVQLDGFKVETRSRKHIALVDQPENGGGTDAGPTPLEYLFISLAGCIVTIGHMVARQRRLPVRKISVKVEGDLDTDVLLGKRSDVRAGFTGIRAIVEIDADMSLEEKQKFLQEIDERCPISDNIHNLTPIEFVVVPTDEPKSQGSLNL
ncbi:MAG TPA: OsmC family protein [Anaerolineaceae bacterium]|nr:OsmC family protein [Anaerolineaceae bacterium]